MNPTEIIERMASDGLTLSVSSDGNLKILGDQYMVNSWMKTIRENKAGNLSEIDTSGKSCPQQIVPMDQPLQILHPCRPCALLKATAVQQTFNERSTDKYSVIVKYASTDPVLVKVTIKGLTSFDIAIPQPYYDGIALLEVLEKYAVGQEEAA